MIAIIDNGEYYSDHSIDFAEVGDLDDESVLAAYRSGKRGSYCRDAYVLGRADRIDWREGGTSEICDYVSLDSVFVEEREGQWVGSLDSVFVEEREGQWVGERRATYEPPVYGAVRTSLPHPLLVRLAAHWSSELAAPPQLTGTEFDKRIPGEREAKARFVEWMKAPRAEGE